MRIGVVNAIAPPAAGSRGERTAFLVRELARRGHRVTVVRANLPAGYPQVDPVLEEIMSEHPVERIVVGPGLAARLRFDAPAAAPLRLVCKAISEIAWPDPWAGFTANALKALLPPVASLDVVITSGQPWSDHLVGYELNRRSGLPWVADYGDPWGLSLHGDCWRRNVSFDAERAMLRSAARIVVTTEPTAEMFTARYGVSAERLAVIPAGIESDLLPPPPAREGLALSHAGTVYGPRASIHPLLDAVACCRERFPLALDWFGELHRAGDTAAVTGVATDYRRRVPYRTVCEAERSADAILIFGNHGGLQLPGKLWRALGSGRPVLAVAADPHDALHRVTGHPQLVVVDNRCEAIVAALDRLHARARNRTHGLTTDRAEALSWRRRADDWERHLVSATRERADRPDPSSDRPSAARLIAWKTLSGAQPRHRLRLIRNRRRAVSPPVSPEKLLLRSWERCTADDWTGWDPYDGLMTGLWPVRLLCKTRWTRLALIQAVRRSPFNLRPLLRIPRLRNPKALALGLETACRLTGVGRWRERAGEEADRLVRSLLNAATPTEHGVGWGYPFDWQARRFWIPRGLPTVVCTGFAVRALDTARRTLALDGDTRQRLSEAIVDAAYFVTKDLRRTADDYGFCFSYSPRDRSEVVNATLLGGEIVARAAAITGSRHELDTVRATVRWALARQSGEGGWVYGAAEHHRWEDGFHTGFNLLSLLAIRRACSELGCDPECTAPLEPISLAAAHYAERFFDDEGRPAYYRHTPWPADSHAAAVAVLTLLECGELLPGARERAETVLAWTVRNLWDRSGHFVYQVHRGYRNRTPFLRWSEAWMLRALAEWYVRQPDGGQNEASVDPTCLMARTQ